MKKIWFVLALAFVMSLTLSSCASMVVTDKNVPVEERATLYLVGENYNIDKVDGKRLGFLGIMKGPKGTATGGLIKKELKASAQIPPGEHTVTIYHGFGRNKNLDITYDFQPGRKYRIDFAIPTDGDVAGYMRAAAISGDVKFDIAEITGEIPKE